MKKILIVEDDASLILGLESALQDDGYETFTARTGRVWPRVQPAGRARTGASNSAVRVVRARYSGAK